MGDDNSRPVTPLRPRKSSLLVMRQAIGDLGFTVLICGAVSLAGWLPLRLAPAAVAHAISYAASVGTKTSTLAALVAEWKGIAAPLLFTIVMFACKRRISSYIGPLVAKVLPTDWMFIVAPAMATAIFTMSWSYTHLKKWDEWGFLPQILFPAAIGIFSFVSARHGAAVRYCLRHFLIVRDIVPRFLRLIASILLPSAISLLVVQHIHDLPLAGQLSLVLSTLISYLVMLQQPSPAQAARKSR
jgi:hypothetical protein